jgi:hypothetical protein
MRDSQNTHPALDEKYGFMSDPSPSVMRRAYAALAAAFEYAIGYLGQA